MSIRASVDARSLDQRVTFDVPVTEQSDSGEPVIEWAPVVTCWARVDGAKAHRQEPYIEGGLRTVGDYVVWIRADVFKRYSLTPLHRVRWNSKTFNIRDIPDQGLAGRLIAVIASTGLNDG